MSLIRQLICTGALLSLVGLAHSQAAAPAAASAAPPAAAAAPASPAAVAAASAVASDEGKVAYYGRKFAKRKTASGERFNPGAMTMAHKSLPFGTRVKVTNLKNKRSVVVRVNDRGPTTPDRVGDLSYAAARKLNMLRSGVIQAKLEVVGQPKAGMGKKARKAKA